MPANSSQVTIVPAVSGVTTLSTSLAVSYTILSGTLRAEWSADAWVGAQFTYLSAPQARVYDEHNTLVASGTIQARSVLTLAIALALGDALTYTIDGKGRATFYAPATSGLGVGGNWVTYTAQMHSGGAYGIGVQGAVVTVNGQEYTGTLVLVTSEPASLVGMGHTLAPDFANRVTIHSAMFPHSSGSPSTGLDERHVARIGLISPRSMMPDLTCTPLLPR